MPVSVQQYIERLTQSGLMSAAEVSALTEKLPADQRPSDVQALARLLVKQGKLTKYQAALARPDHCEGVSGQVHLYSTRAASSRSSLGTASTNAGPKVCLAPVGVSDERADWLVAAENIDSESF